MLSVVKTQSYQYYFCSLYRRRPVPSRNQKNTRFYDEIFSSQLKSKHGMGENHLDELKQRPKLLLDFFLLFVIKPFNPFPWQNTCCPLKQRDFASVISPKIYHKSNASS